MEISKELNEMIYHGDQLNEIGIFQAAIRSGGTLKKDVFIEIIRRNYGYSCTEDLLIDYKGAIDSLWKRAKTFIADIGYLVNWYEHEITVIKPIL